LTNGRIYVSIGGMRTDGRSIPHDTLESLRCAAIRLHEEGVRVDVIGKSFKVTAKAVYEWIKRYREGGKEALKSRKAPGPVPLLNAKQFEELVGELHRPATELGYATDLWSGPRIRHLVKHRFGVEYHPKHMPRFLRRLGLVLRFPQRRALEQDPEALRQWKEERLPGILANARKRKALVFYADESLVSLIPYVGKSWTFPKVRSVVRVSGKRGQHVGVTGAVNAQGRLSFELTREHERFTAKTFLRFIRKMRRDYPTRPIVLIVDGAPIHKAKAVRAFVDDNSWLQLEILPPYSPEENPTEKSWGFIKTKKLNGSTAKDKSELRKAVTTAMKNLKRDAERVASFFV
jgi:transposase